MLILSLHFVTGRIAHYVALLQIFGSKDASEPGAAVVGFGFRARSEYDSVTSGPTAA